MESRGRLWILAAGGLLLAVLVVAFFLLRGGGTGEQPPPVETAAASPAPEPTATPLQTLVPPLPEGVTLDGSDGAVRTVVRVLSSNPVWIKWLASEDLVRRFVAAVDNVAQGKSPRSHLDFARPGGKFRVLRRGKTLVADPRSFHRYDLAAEVFASLDAAGTVAALAELEPLMEQAYAEIGRPGTTFRETLWKAIAHLLATPVVPAGVPLEEKVVTYRYADPRLEDLSDAQRHLLRMGPRNVQRVQEKLRELARAMGMPEAMIPPPSTYEP